MTSNVGTGTVRHGFTLLPADTAYANCESGTGSGNRASVAYPSTSLKARVAAVPGLDPAHLKAAGHPEVQQVLESLLGALKNVSDAELQLGERHGDGSLRVASHLAVWLIGKVTDAYGKKLVRLSKVPDRESLRQRLRARRSADHRHRTQAGSCDLVSDYIEPAESLSEAWLRTLEHVHDSGGTP